MQYNHTIETRSVYIHWPFCPYKCHFCPFVAFASHDQFMQQYHDALCKELREYGQKLDKKMVLDTLYLGGGTPSTYPDELLLDMSGTLRNIAVLKDNAEFTIEVNPGTIHEGQFEVWKQCGINRLSVGVQSLKDDVLKKLNRHQSARDVYALLQKVDGVFENVSVDLILGLPGVSPDEWKDFLHKVVTWPIKHISLYFLMVHENTQLYFGVKKKNITLPCDDEIVDLYCWSIKFLAQHGFAQYEVSSFAKPGFESKHNTVYWERKPYKGFGVGACSFDGTSRFQHEKNLMKYLAGVEQEKNITFFSETLTPEQKYLEKVMLGLRRSKGALVNDLLDDLSDQQKVIFNERVANLYKNGFVAKDGERLKLTPAGLAVENEVIVQLSL